MTVCESTTELKIPAAFRRVDHGFSFSVDEAQSRLAKFNGQITDSEATLVNDSILELERPMGAAGDPAGDETGRTLFVLHGEEIRTFARPLAAQAYVEELISTGVDQQEIQAFEGSSLRVEVSFKPVVSLGTDIEAA